MRPQSTDVSIPNELFLTVTKKLGISTHAGWSSWSPKPPDSYTIEKILWLVAHLAREQQESNPAANAAIANRTRAGRIPVAPADHTINLRYSSSSGLFELELYLGLDDPRDIVQAALEVVLDAYNYISWGPEFHNKKILNQYHDSRGPRSRNDIAAEQQAGANRPPSREN